MKFIKILYLINENKIEIILILMVLILRIMKFV